MSYVVGIFQLLYNAFHEHINKQSFFFPTDPDPVTGDMESAMAVELNPWVEYEFRVVASNAIGTGDPSMPSRAVRTKEAGESPQATSAACIQHSSRTILK